jgi:hypothetical protein
VPANPHAHAEAILRGETRRGLPLRRPLPNSIQTPKDPIPVVIGQLPPGTDSLTELRPNQEEGLDIISEQVYQVARLDREAERIRRQGGSNRAHLRALAMQRDAVLRNAIRVASEHDVHSSVVHHLYDTACLRRYDTPVTLRQHGTQVIAFNPVTGLHVTPYDEAHVNDAVQAVHQSNTHFRTHAHPNMNPLNAQQMGIVPPPEEVFHL